MILGWTNTNAAELRAFLNTATGSLYLRGLTANAESIPRGNGIEEEALFSREARGARGQVDLTIEASNFVQQEEHQREDVDVETPTRQLDKL